MGPSLFRFKIAYPGHPHNGQTVFECNMNRRENARKEPILDAQNREQCMQCRAVSGQSAFGKAWPPGYNERNGRGRCSRSTCLNSLYCWQHLRQICHLGIHASTFFPGSIGLYAECNPEKYVGRNAPEPEIVFNAGDIVKSGIPLRGVKNSLYGGEPVSKRKLDARYDYQFRGNTIEPTGPYAHEFKQGRGGSCIMDAACVRGPLAFANSVSQDPETGAYYPHAIRKAQKPNANIIGEGVHKGDMYVVEDIYDGDEILIDYGFDYFDNMIYMDHETGPIRLEKPKKRVNPIAAYVRAAPTKRDTKYRTTRDHMV